MKFVHGVLGAWWPDGGLAVRTRGGDRYFITGGVDRSTVCAELFILKTMV